MNKDLSISINEATKMSSLDIAELTKKTVGNIHVDIKNLIDSLKDDRDFNHNQYQKVTDNRGYISSYTLDKELTTILVSGYSIAMRAKIVRRWQELESKQSQVPSNFLEAMQLATKTLEQNELLCLENQSQADKIEVDQPKVDFYHQIFSDNPLVSFNDYAKLLSKETGVKIGQNNLMKFLRESGYLMIGRAGSKSNERNKPYQKYVIVGYFEVEYIKTQVGLKPQTFITAKGQMELAEMIVNHFTK